jgi:hypothetical protein
MTLSPGSDPGESPGDKRLSRPAQSLLASTLCNRLCLLLLWIDTVIIQVVAALRTTRPSLRLHPTLRFDGRALYRTATITH